MFYVNLRKSVERVENRWEALESDTERDRGAYQHRGRFDQAMLRYFDNRPAHGGELAGDQFPYRLKTNGEFHRGKRGPMESAGFRELLRQTKDKISELGAAIFRGEVKPDPYQHKTRTACDLCDYQSICRIDPHSHEFRVLGRS
jgi:ATP-dependent helicase/nuclease subunit B